MLPTKSIRFFVAAKTAPWIAIFLLIASSVIVFIEKSIFSEQLNQLQQERIDRFTENKQRVIDSFLGQVNAIASNELVVSGLVDIEQSSNYLLPLIKSYSLVGTSVNSVKIVDYNGSVIVANGIEVSALQANDFAIFEHVIHNVISDYEYTSAGIVFIAPVWVASSAEGAVIVEVPYRDLNELFSIDTFGGEIVNINRNDELLFASNKDLAANFFKEGASQGHSFFLDSKQYGKWYVAEAFSEGGDVVYSFENKDFIIDKLYWLTLLGITSLIIAFAGSLVTVLMSSSIISRTLNNLLHTLQSSKSGREQLKTHITKEDAPDELKEIYRNFDKILNDLTLSESFGNDIQSIINSLSEYLVVFDMKGEVSLSNRSFQTFSSSILGDAKVFEKVIPKILQEKALSTEKSMKDFECVYTVFSDFIDGLKNSKSERVIRWSRSLYLNPQNTVGGLTFIGVDITEQKSTEKDIKDKNKAIEDLSQRFSLALEAAFIGVWEFNGDSNALIWDDRMHDIYKVSKEEFTGSVNDWIACVHPEDFERTNELLQKSLETAEDFFADFRIIWPNNEVRWISANARVINDEGVLRVVGANIDITETKRLNEELESALKKAEELVKIKSEFLASMSHEIRTPMNGVLGMLNLLSRTPLSGQQSRYTELAHSSADSLLTLINDILDFSKVDAGKLDLECIDFNLPDLLGEVSEAMAQRAQDKGLEVVLDIADVNTESVNGDPSRIRQVFTNLIGNAIKFTDKGEIFITAATKTTATGDLILSAAVKDTGIGIPENKIDSLFDSFSQVDASTTRKYGGTGLGLAIVKQLCELMGGGIQIESCVNYGSTFRFTLVLACAKHADATDIKIASERQAINLEDKLFIVIDNNTANAAAVKKQLTVWHADVEVMYTIADAMTYLQGSVLPAMIFVNHEMPEVQGLDFVEKIRKNQVFDHVKIVLMTHISSTINTEKLQSLKHTSSLLKPVTRKDFVHCLFADDTLEEPEILSVTPMPMPPSVKAETKAEEASSTRKARILLVEDNLINQEVALGILASLDLTADIAENGLEAINILNEKKYDLILMDCQMPQMDGYATTRAIRSGKTLQYDIPIIAMTANAMKGDKEKCLAAGMDDYLSKPINPQQLIEKIDEWSMAQANAHSEDEVGPMASITDNHENAIIWDRSDFMSRIMNNENLAHKLVDLFKVDTPKTLDEMGAAVDSEQATEAGLLAHKLKGTVSNLGGKELADLAYKIEQAGREEDMTSIKHLWPMVRPKYDQLLEQIERGL